MPKKEFKTLVIKLLIELRKIIDEHSENFNKELENIKRNELGLKNTIAEVKSILEGMNS